MAGLSRWERMRLNSAAAGLYMSDPSGAELTGMSWQELSEDDKDMWRTKAASKGPAHQYLEEEED